MAKTSFVIADMFSTEHGIVAKLQQKSSATSVVEGLGSQVRTKQCTYYYPCGIGQEVKYKQLIGNTVALDPAEFDIIEKEMKLPDNGKIITTKWLYTIMTKA